MLAMIQHSAIVKAGRRTTLVIGDTSEIISKYNAVKGKSMIEADNETDSDCETNLEIRCAFPKMQSCLLLKCSVKTINPSIPKADI